MSRNIPNWLRPERTIWFFALFCAITVIPFWLFGAAQGLRHHYRAERVLQLEPGLTREQVLARVGSPDSAEGLDSAWLYGPSDLGLLCAPLIEQSEWKVRFFPDGRL